MIVLCFSGCSKTEDANLTHSSLTVIGQSSDIELLDIQVSHDGGVLVAAHSRQKGNQDIRILKYDQNLILLWDRIIGGPLDDKMEKMFVDAQGNILISGFSYGFDEDLDSLRNLRSWVPYDHLLTSEGKTKWEYGHVGYPRNTPDQVITDVYQDAEGNYLISGNISVLPRLPDNTIIAPSRFPVVRKFDVHGSPTGTLVFHTGITRGQVNSVVEKDGIYTILGNNLNGLSQRGEVFESQVDGFNLVNVTSAIDSTDWMPDLGSFENPTIILKTHSDDNVISHLIYSDKIYRFGWNFNSRQFISEVVQLPFKNVQTAKMTSDNHILFILDNGTVIETDQSLNTMNTFMSNLPLTHINKLNSEYVAGFSQNRTIYLVQLNTEGEVIQNNE